MALRSAVLIISLVALWTTAAAGGRELSEAQAGSLVLAAINVGPAARLEASPNNLLRTGPNRDFFGFGEYGPDPAKQVLRVRYYAVNRRTGDVWLTEGSVCQRLDGRRLRVAQASIRRQLGVASETLQALRFDKPAECD